jgi:hypothetical protein
MLRAVIRVLFVTLLIPASALAQTAAGGRVSGVVKDEQGASIPGVTIEARSDAAPGIYRTTTDRAGQYHLTNLPPADYDITAELTGFATVKRPAVVVRAGLTATVDITMTVGAIGETVEVRMETPLLEARHGSQAVNVSGDLLGAVPLTERREWYGALAAIPGVVTSEFGGSKLFYVRGSDIGMTLIQLDGTDVTPAAKAGPNYLQLNTDAIADIQVQTGGPSAATPLGNGGVVNIATASGTNRPKGAATLYLQPRAWNDSNQPGGTSTAVDQRQIDLSFGGPIVRDRVWGFGSLRDMDTSTGVSRSATQLAVLQALVSGFQPLDTTNDARFWLGKITAQSGRHQLAGFYQRDTNPVFSITSVSEFPSGQSTGGPAMSLRVSSVWSNRLNTTATVSYNNKRREGRTSGDSPTIRVHNGTIASGGRLTGNGLLASLGTPVLSRLTQPNEKITGSIDTTLYLSHGRMTHELQAGLFAQQRVQGNHLVYVNGGFTLEEHVLRQPGVYTSGTVPFHRLIMNGPALTTFHQRTRDVAGYLQDSWSPTPRITVSAGVRLDQIVTRDLVFGIRAQKSLEVGPRTGVNYSVTADGRNLARGHWARVHDVPGLVTTTGTPSVGQRDLYDVDLDGTFETVFVTPASSGTIVNRSIAPDLHQPFVQEWGAGYSRQLPRGLTGHVDFAHRRFIDRPTLVEVNGKYDGKVFTGYSNESLNEIYRATNNRWNTPVYSSLELSVTQRTSRVQLLGSYVRQWRHIDGTWQPNDPASFIQPDAFANHTGIGSTTGTASAPSDASSLSGTHMTQIVNASAQWQDHVARASASIDGPWRLVLAANYTFQSGTWSGPIVSLLPAADPAFGPATVTLSNGRVVSNPLATRVRFAFATRGDGQLRTPHLHALNVRAGRRVDLRRVKVDLSLDVFNVTNHGADLGFESNANQTYSPTYGVTGDRQRPRSAQIVLRASF